MPVIKVDKLDLFERLGQTYEDLDFYKLCFDFGIEAELTSEFEMKKKEQGADAAKGASKRELYEVEIPANRYDLLCVEGLAQALRVFLGKDKTPQFSVTPKKLQMIVKDSQVNQIRPYIVCAVLRDINLDIPPVETDSKYDNLRIQSLMDLQTKLHQNLCRHRKYASIGTHDLDTIEGPFTYEALPPEDIVFKPLVSAYKQDKEVNAKELLQDLSKGNALSPYVPLIIDSPVYPIIYDAKRRVLSLPPIINSEHSKVTTKTKNMLIEITALDKKKAGVVLDTMVAMFSCYCKEPFTVEQVEIVRESDKSATVTPTLPARKVTSSVKYINTVTGLQLTPEQMGVHLQKMMLGPTETIADGKEISVQVPISRSDVFHACDLVEDVAIAYGYTNLTKRLPPTNTIGVELPLNKMRDHMRDELAAAGYTEILTLALCSKKECFKMLNRKNDGKTAVEIDHSKDEKGQDKQSSSSSSSSSSEKDDNKKEEQSAEESTKIFEVGRPCLLTGMLKSVASNKSHAMPLSLFEISEIMLLDPETDTGAKNNLRICAAYSDLSLSGIENIHGLSDYIMHKMGISGNDHYLVQGDDPAFMDSRCANIMVGKTKVGVLGIVHPKVLKAFGIPFPTTALEIDFELLINLCKPLSEQKQQNDKLARQKARADRKKLIEKRDAAKNKKSKKKGAKNNNNNNNNKNNKNNNNGKAKK